MNSDDWRSLSASVSGADGCGPGQDQLHEVLFSNSVVSTDSNLDDQANEGIEGHDTRIHAGDREY